MFHELQQPGDGVEQTMTGGLASSFGVHLLVAAVILYLGTPRMARTIADAPLILGYFGPTHDGTVLDALQPGGLRFYFSRPASAGAPHHSPPRLAHEATVPAKPASLVKAGRRARHAAARPDGALASAGNLVHTSTAGEVDATGAEDYPPVPDALPALQADVPFSESFVILRLVKPAYPEHELTQRISARILIAVHVTPEGEIDETQVQDAKTDPLSSSSAFELSALEALRQWRVRLPAVKKYADGCWLTVPVEFRPEDEGFKNLGHVPQP